MKLFLQRLLQISNIFLALLLLFLVDSCKENDNSLAPYAGSPAVSNITVEDTTYTPRISWLGGYATVVGINHGKFAALDSSLVWLIYQGGNNIHYPVTYPQVPQGATDLTSQYGGHTVPLIEDQTYTYWVMKEDIWNQIKDQHNKVLRLNDSLKSGYQVVSDTIEISQQSYYQLKKNIDKYVNIYDISYFGSPDIILGHINVIQTDTSNSPIISWTVTQLNVTDTLISAMGLVTGTGYDPAKVVWEVYSVDTVNGAPVFGKSNVIPSPVYPPYFNVPKTYTFTAYPSTGLQRNSGYYLWIAAKQWDQKNRLRITPYYAYITFKTS